VVVWTDTPEDRQAIQEAYGEAVRVRGEQEELVAAQLSRIQDLQARQQELSDELGSLRQKSLQEAVGLKAAQARADKLQADLEEATQLLDIAKGSLEQKDGIISRQATALASSEKALRESEARVEEQRRLVQSKDEDLAILQGELEDARALRLPTHQDVPDSWWRRFLSWF
jgi:chromosome segregation ATPase